MTTEEAQLAARELLGEQAHLQYDEQAPTATERDQERQLLDQLLVELAQMEPPDVPTLRKELQDRAFVIADLEAEGRQAEMEKPLRLLIKTTQELRRQLGLADRRLELKASIKKLRGRLVTSKYKVGRHWHSSSRDCAVFTVFGLGDSWEEALKAAQEELQSREG